MAGLIVRYTRPNTFRIGPKRFFPGINELTLEQWDAIKDHPLLPARFAAGDLQWIDGKCPDNLKKEKSAKVESNVESKTPEKVEEKSALADLNVKDAKKLIEEALDVTLLEKWKTLEKRKAIAQIIDKQIQKILEPEKKEAV